MNAHLLLNADSHRAENFLLNSGNNFHSFKSKSNTHKLPYEHPCLHTQLFRHALAWGPPCKACALHRPENDTPGRSLPNIPDTDHMKSNNSKLKKW